MVSHPDGRAWGGLSVLFLAQMLAIGTASFGYGLFVEPLSTEFGLSRADAGSGLIVIVVGMALWSPLIGRALDKLPSRRVLLGAALAFAAGLVITALSHNLLLTAGAAFVLIAGGAAALGPLSGSTLTARWFGDHRGRALGVVAVSSSMGGFLVVPLLGWAISQVGWRASLLALAGFICVVLSALILIVIREPAPGNVKHAPGAMRASQSSYTARQLIGMRDLWLLVIVIGTMLAISQTLLSILIPYATDQGVGLGQASLLVSAASMSSVAGKLVIGALAERIDLRWLQLFVVVMMATFLAILSLNPSYPVMLAACLLAGMSVGGTLPLWAAFVSMRFGPASVGQAMGLMVFLQLPLLFGALWIAGATFDRTGHYHAALLGFLALLPVVALAILPVRMPKADNVS